MFVFLFLIIKTCFLCAQQKALSFEHLTIENGLPENYPRCIIQDKTGYIWIGTQNGLVSFDGYSTKVYKLVTGKQEGSGKEQITCLFSDSQGILWVGMRHDGLFRSNPGNDNFTRVKAGTGAEHLSMHGEVRQITEDGKGNLWIVSYDYKDRRHKLARYNSVNGSFVDFCNNITQLDSRSVNAIYALFRDKKERIWLGTNNGLYLYDEPGKTFKRYLTGIDPAGQKTISGIYEAPSQPGILWLRGKYTNTGKGFGLIRFDANNKTFTSYLHNGDNALPDDSISSLLEDYKKRFWIGTAKGISLLDRSTGKFSSYFPKDDKPETNANIVSVIQDDKSGDLWMAGGKGLLRFDTHINQFIRYTAEEERADGLPTNNIENIFIDGGGIIWLTTKKSGLHRINKQRSIFTQFKNIIGKPESYPGGNTVDFAQGSDKENYWMATDKGLVHWSSLTNKFVKINLGKDVGELSNTITRVIFDKEGKVWCGDLQKGLYCYNPATGTVKNYHNIKDDSTSISNNYVRTILEDRSGTIWVGTYGGGLCRFNKATGTFTRYPYMNYGQTPANKELDDSLVTSLYEDKKGILWIGTAQGGLNRFDRTSNTFTSYHDTKKGFEFINKILEDSRGRFWISSFLYGLHLFDRNTGTSRRFTEKNGLLCDVIQTFQEAGPGDLWITSVRGLCRLNTKTFTFSNYTKSQGVPESNLSRGLLFTGNNELLVGCVGGFLTFSPADIIPNRFPPFVNIESVSYINPSKGKEKDFVINGQKGINLGFNEKQISFHYTALHFNNPALNQYAYKLEGYDNDWVQGGTTRTATYTNLSPGTYTFFVKAANSDGVWTESPRSFNVIINPPWWATWWAYLIFAAIAAIIAWVIFKIVRANHLNVVNHRLEEKVLQRTKELKHSLEELRETQAQLIQREKMASLGELTAGVAHEIQNPLNFINNFSDVNVELIQELKHELNSGNKEEALSIAGDIADNECKINHHGKRADAIVKGMLQHSRTSNGKKELTDINALADEYLRLSYHGLRAKDKSFNAEMQTSWDDSLTQINVVSQDVGRVILNLFTNAFYSVHEKSKKSDKAYSPMVSVTTKQVGNKAEIRIKDNGNGIPQNVLNKIYQPFFTTKPTGEGTGLGLSLSYDIITKGHGGEIKVETEEGKGAEFIISIPNDKK